MLSPYGAAASLAVATVKSGNRIMGRSAVTGMGAASLTHQVTIQAPRDSTTTPLYDRAVCESRKYKRANNSGPRIRPTVLLLEAVAVKGIGAKV